MAATMSEATAGSLLNERSPISVLFGFVTMSATGAKSTLKPAPFT